MGYLMIFTLELNIMFRPHWNIFLLLMINHLMIFNDILDLPCFDGQNPFLTAEDRAQLRNEFLAFDTQNTGTITHLQVRLPWQHSEYTCWR